MYDTDVWGHACVWSMFKNRVVELLIRAKKQKTKSAKKEINVISAALKRWSIKATQCGSDDQHERVREALRKRLVESKNKLKTRSKEAAYKRLLYEEKSTKEMFMGLKAPQETQWIESLKIITDWDNVPTGQEYTETQESQNISETQSVIVNYYSWLFSPKPSDPEASKHFTDLLEKRQLSEEARNSLEGEITVKETYKSMSTLAKGKSPGPDSLPNEFYKTFAGLLAPTLTKVLNEALDNETLPECMKRGSISLLYKKKDRRDMRNYRPITLLNGDYKILTRVLCWRMKRVMHEIVSPENTGFSPGRFIGENSILTKLIQAYLDEEEEPGALVFIDMEKAFDRVSWEFMHKALAALGFGPDFRRFIRTLYDATKPQKRRVVVNGHASSYFSLGSGVAQGDPISPLLYLCVAESLTRAINANPRIKGITVRGKETKLSQFADDTMMALADTQQSWDASKEELYLYEEATGQKVNIEKTEVVLAGALRHINTPLPQEWKVCQEGNYIISLGVPIGNDFDEDEFWLSKYFKCKAKLARWKHLFTHSIRGRILISQASVYSRFRYWLNSMMPSPTVDEYIRQDIRHLLWSNHPRFDGQEAGTPAACAPPFLSKEAAQLQWGKGGISVLNWEIHSKAFRAHWFQRYLDSTTGTWKIFFDHWILKGHQEGRGVILNPKKKKDMFFPNHHLLKFFKDALNTFRSLTWIPQPEPTTKEAVASIPLWHSHLINPYMFDDTSIQALMDMQFFTVEDLWDANTHSPWTPNEVYDGFTSTGENFSQNQLQRMLGIEDEFFYAWHKLINEIPHRWWKLLRLPIYAAQEGQYFAYEDEHEIKYAYLVDADLRSIIPCEITTRGSLHCLEEIEELPEEAIIYKILYDHRGCVVGPEEKSYPRWFEWKLQIDATQKRAASCRIKHIYTALIGEQWRRPNCEANWDERDIDPPPRGWGEVWEQFLGLIGTPRDYKTRFKFLHRGLWTQHKQAIVARQYNIDMSARCILCEIAQGTHIHFVCCEELDRSFRWLDCFGQLMNMPLDMTLEDRIYGNMNGGHKMPKGLIFFYSILTKFWWQGYTKQNNEKEIFNDKKEWINSLRRLKIAIHAFEVESRIKFDWLQKRLHPLLGYSPQSYDKAKEEELKRRNNKLKPLAEIDFDESKMELKMAFKWKDAANIINNDDSE